MKLVSLALGMILSTFGFAQSNTDPAPGTPTTPVEPLYYGSCVFEGQFASGCIEFYDGTWTAESQQTYCEKQSKAGTTPLLSADYCPRVDYNTLCAAKQEDGSLANFYVNNMPAFICKKYMSGVLTKRPVDGWPEPTTPAPGPVNNQ